MMDLFTPVDGHSDTPLFRVDSIALSADAQLVIGIRNLSYVGTVISLILYPEEKIHSCLITHN